MTFLLIIIKFITHSLHFILSSPSLIDALDNLEALHFDIMFQFYKKIGLKNSGCWILPIPFSNQLWLPLWGFWCKWDIALKTHVILEHFSWYFENSGTNFRLINGEFVEAGHYTKKRHEVYHGFVTKKKQVTKHHLLRQIQSLSSYNSMRVVCWTLVKPIQQSTLFFYYRIDNKVIIG